MRRLLSIGFALLVCTASAAPSRLGYGLVVTGGEFTVETTGTNRALVNGSRVLTVSDLAGITSSPTIVASGNTNWLSVLTVGNTAIVAVTARGTTAMARAESSASNGAWNAQVNGASNLAASAYVLATNALPVNGGTMSGTLNAPKLRGTNTVFMDWRSTVGTYDGRIVHGAATVSDGGQVGFSIIGDAGGVQEAIEIGPFYSAGTIFGGGFIRMSGNDPVNLGRAASIGFIPTYGTGSAQTTALVKVYSSTDSALWARRFEGDASGLTNVALANSTGVLPSGALGTNVSREVGGIVTTGSISAALFQGNGAGLTNLAASSGANPWTNFFQEIASTQSFAVTIPVPTNSLDANRIEVTWRYLQTNDAFSATLYLRLNGISGTNSYQSYLRNEGTPTTPTSPGSTNDGCGLVIGRLFSARNFTNTLSWGYAVIDNIMGTNIQTRGVLSTSMAKGRETMIGNQAFVGTYGGLATFAGAITQIQIFAVTATGTSVIDTQSMTSARFMP